VTSPSDTFVLFDIFFPAARFISLKTKYTNICESRFNIEDRDNDTIYSKKLIRIEERDWETEYGRIYRR